LQLCGLAELKVLHLGDLKVSEAEFQELQRYIADAALALSGRIQ
jgi:hypothetical protein